jgi:hypothetical protein
LHDPCRERAGRPAAAPTGQDRASGRLTRLGW